MPSFLFETYAPAGPGGFEQSWRLARQAASLASEVRYRQTLFLPSDELALHLFEAPCVDTVRAAGELGPLMFDRIVEAIVTNADPT